MGPCHATVAQCHMACAALITGQSLNYMFLCCSELAQSKDEPQLLTSSLPGPQLSPNPSIALPPLGDKHKQRRGPITSFTPRSEPNK